MRLSLLILAALAISAPVAAAERNFGVEDFSRIRIDGPFKVRLITGVAPFAKATGPMDALDDVAIDIEGDTLVVHANASNWSSFPGGNAGIVSIAIGTHDLSSAWINGSGKLDIDRVKGPSFEVTVAGSGAASVGNLAVDTFKLGMSGSGSALIAGTAPTVTAIVRGASSFDGSALIAKDATLGAEGTAVIKLTATDAVILDTQGPATVTLNGGPACTLRADGPAEVTGCRGQTP